MRFLKLLQNRGFTLIEVMVVVVIIGILCAIAIPNFEGQFNRAKVGRAVAELKALQNLVELYKIEHHNYPSCEEFKILVQQNGYKEWGEAEGIQDPWGRAYYYNVNKGQERNEYYLWSAGPDKNEKDAIVASQNKRNPQKDVEKPDTSNMDCTASCGE